MKLIGERISILKKDDMLSVVILPTADNKKLMLLFLWLAAWSVCGFLVFINYFQLIQNDAKVFVIVYLSFWAYYEVKILRAFIWKKWGREKIWITKGKIYYQREVNNKGKVDEFNIDEINELKLIDIVPGNFSDFFNQSFWVKGGERIEFSHLAKKIRFGMQLTTEEARAVLAELRSKIN
jgi:hypothetical protein